MRTYRVLGKIQPEEVPLEECEDLAHQLEDLEALVASTRRALQARLVAKGDAGDTAGREDSTGSPANGPTAQSDHDDNGDMHSSLNDPRWYKDATIYERLQAPIR
ncbi:MAG: hypothetical protein ABI670_07645 [Chloroflexota bacterium]